MRKKILIALGILIAVILILGVIAPTEFHVEKQIVINQPKEVVFAQLKLLKNHDAWSPWVKKDPNIKKEYRGQDGTIGFIAAWSGNDEVGAGEQEIKNIVEGEKVETEIRFTKPIEDVSQTYLMTEAQPENKTLVKWGMSGKTPFPINIVCLVMNMQTKLGAQFTEGLNSLKTQLEK